MACRWRYHLDYHVNSWSPNYGSLAAVRWAAEHFWRKDKTSAVWGGRAAMGSSVLIPWQAVLRNRAVICICLLVWGVPYRKISVRSNVGTQSITLPLLRGGKLIKNYTGVPILKLQDFWIKNTGYIFFVGKTFEAFTWIYKNTPGNTVWIYYLLLLKKKTKHLENMIQELYLSLLMHSTDTTSIQWGFCLSNSLNWL